MIKNLNIKKYKFIVFFVNIHSVNGKVSPHAVFWTFALFLLLIVSVTNAISRVKDISEYEHDSGILIDVMGNSKKSDCNKTIHLKSKDGLIYEYRTCRGREYYVDVIGKNIDIWYEIGLFFPFEKKIVVQIMNSKNYKLNYEFVKNNKNDIRVFSKYLSILIFIVIIIRFLIMRSNSLKKNGDV